MKLSHVRIDSPGASDPPMVGMERSCSNDQQSPSGIPRVGSGEYSLGESSTVRHRTAVSNQERAAGRRIYAHNDNERLPRTRMEP